MTPRCRVCSHPKRKEIDRALLGGEESLRDMARRFRVSKDSLNRHRLNHLPARMAEVAKRYAEADVSVALDVVSELRRVNDAAKSVLRDALDAGDGSLTLQASDRILRQVEVQSRLIGLLNDGAVTQVSVNIGADWPAIRSALLHALQPYPEARAAVVDALAGLEGS